ncbi:hypothetical protein SUGI_0900820 [Cryptomeria japonica]|nr:hypothetical protein SUGI_0900820 [Cryptomeria japonica]
MGARLILSPRPRMVDNLFPLEYLDFQDPERVVKQGIENSSGLLQLEAGIDLEPTTPKNLVAIGPLIRRKGKLRVYKEERMGGSRKCRYQRWIWCAIGNLTASKQDLQMGDLIIARIQVSMDLFFIQARSRKLVRIRRHALGQYLLWMK